MKCKECGKDNAENTKYCFYCGTELSENEIEQKPEKKSYVEVKDDILPPNNTEGQIIEQKAPKTKNIVIISAVAAGALTVGIVLLLILFNKPSATTNDSFTESTVTVSEITEKITEADSTEAITTEPDLRIPNVVGMKSGDAIEKINDLELKYKAEFEYSDNTPADYIISQSPAEDKKAGVGDTVNIVISKGAKDIVSSNSSSSSSNNSYLEQSSSSSYVTPSSDTTDYYGLRVSSRYISSSDISWMKLDEIQFAINEVYAKLGYQFTKGKEKTYFESMDWYHPDTHDMYVIESRMNKYEYENIKIMGAYRDSLKK